jgi:hypothetical protein
MTRYPFSENHQSHDINKNNCSGCVMSRQSKNITHTQSQRQMTSAGTWKPHQKRDKEFRTDGKESERREHASPIVDEESSYGFKPFFSRLIAISWTCFFT